MASTRLITACIPLLLLATSYLLLGEIQYSSLILKTASGHHALSLLSNAYHPWQIDPLTRLLCLLFHFPLTEKSISTIAYSILGFGLAIFATRASKTPLLTSIAAGVTVSMLQFLFGIDVITVPALAWIPWLLYSLILPSSPLTIFARMLFFALHIFSAGALSCLTVPSIFLLTNSLLKEEKRYLSITSLAFMFLCFTFYIPEWSVPDYPPLGHVVSDDGVPGHVWPLTSESAPIPLLDRPALREALMTPVLSLLLLLGVGLCFFRRPPVTYLGVSLLLLILAWDLLLPENLAIIGPLQTVRRFIPGAFAYSFSETAFGLTLLAVPFLLSHFGTILIVLLLFFCQLVFQPAFQLKNGSLTSLQSDKLATVAVSDRRRLGQIIISPSFPVIRDYNIPIEELLNPPRAPETQPIQRGLKIEAFASPGSLLALKSLKDRKRDTRVRIGQGGQEGNEWICISVPKECSLRSLRLLVGNFHTDFPRALKIREGKSCADISENFSHERTFAPWEGPVLWTEQGFPYFGQQSDVLIPLAIDTRAVRFEQIAKSHHDWSIAGLEAEYDQCVISEGSRAED